MLLRIVVFGRDVCLQIMSAPGFSIHYGARTIEITWPVGRMAGQTDGWQVRLMVLLHHSQPRRQTNSKRFRNLVFCSFILGRNRVDSADFQIFLPPTPPPSLQAQVLARAASCKRKCLQGRFRASTSACRGDSVQVQALARNHPRKPICLHKAPRPPAL